MGNELDLYIELVKTNFKLRYKGSILGFIWVLIKPFLIYLMLFVVFFNLGGSSKDLSSGQYSVYLLLGLIIFNYFNESIIWGMNSLMDKAHIILKVNFNRIIALFSSLSLALINFVINCGILTVVSVVVGVNTSVMSIVYMLFVFLVLTLFVLGISFFTSVMLIRLRDLNHISELGLQLVFYGTAVFYPIEIVPEKWRFIVEYNPIAVVIQASRQALLYGDIARLEYIFGLLFVSLILCIFGALYFKNNIKKVAEFF